MSRVFLTGVVVLTSMSVRCGCCNLLNIMDLGVWSTEATVRVSCSMGSCC